MKIFLIIFAIVVSVSTAEAATNQGGGGLGFSCDVNTTVCKCDGDIEGADCKAMSINCKWVDGKRITCPTGAGSCTCTMKIKNRRVKAPIFVL